jgi:uncharacterized protein with HEPN domain
VSRAYRDFLADMVAHARDAVACVEGRTLEEVAADRLRRLALERCFEVLGEAAGKIPADLRARHPELPRADMIAVRHRVAHAYFQVDIAILYRTARDLLPAIVPALERVRDEVAGAEGDPGDDLRQE